MLRALQLGDLLCTVPALRALRAGYPQAHVTLLGLPWAAEFVHRYAHYLDEHIEFPGYPGLPEQPLDVSRIAPFLRQIQAREFDLVLQMQGDGSLVNPLASLLGGRKTAGYYAPPAWCPDPELFAPYPAGAREIHRMLALPLHLGLDSLGDEIDFPLDETDEQAASSLLDDGGIEGSYVCVHPGGRDPRRRWPALRFAAVADALAGRGLQVVVTGSASERPLAAAVAREMQARASNFAGRTSLGTLAALLRGARLLVCNDTGVSHLAAATRTPSVVVFTGSEPERWAPLDAVRHRAMHGPRLSTERFAPASMAAVTAQADELLHASSAYAA